MMRFPHSEMQELQSLKGRLRNILIGILVLPFILLFYALVDYSSGATLHRTWIDLWLVLLSESSTTPVQITILNFSFDLLLIVIILLLPTLVMLLHGNCTQSARALVERFAFLELPLIVLWDILLYFLLFSRMPADALINGGSVFWKQVVGGSLALSFLSWAIINGELGRTITIIQAMEDKKD